MQLVLSQECIGSVLKVYQNCVESVSKASSKCFNTALLTYYLVITKPINVKSTDTDCIHRHLSPWPCKSHCSCVSYSSQSSFHSPLSTLMHPPTPPDCRPFCQFVGFSKAIHGYDQILHLLKSTYRINITLTSDNCASAVDIGIGRKPALHRSWLASNTPVDALRARAWEHVAECGRG